MHVTVLENLSLLPSIGSYKSDNGIFFASMILYVKVSEQSIDITRQSMRKYPGVKDIVGFIQCGTKFHWDLTSCTLINTCSESRPYPQKEEIVKNSVSVF